MNKSYAMLFAVVLGLGACGHDASGAEETEQVDPAELGDLILNLTGSDSSGRQYRLRDGEFSIFGYPEYPVSDPDGGFGGFQTTVSTETDPNAAVISLHVVPGSYYVSLTSTNWYLERRTDTGWERVEKAVLLTPYQSSIYVFHGGVSRINFRFGVDGEIIDFRAGDLEIGIEIEQPGEGPGDAGFPPFPGLFGGLGSVGGVFGGPGGTIGGGAIGGGIPVDDAGVPLPL